MPVHHLMVGTWTPPGAIFTFAFDDEALTLKLVKRTAIPEDEPISWMTFNHDKTAIYGAAMKKWSSFAVHDATTIEHQASHPMLHDPAAASPDANTRAIFLLAARQPPYSVYCNPFYRHAGHGTVFSTSASTGALLSSPPARHYPYQPDSGVHGMALHPSDERFLYSADLPANKLWVHHLPDPAAAPNLVAAIDAPDARDHPRWVALHPSGAHLYLLMEKGNRICEYALDPATKVPAYTGRHFPLIPPGVPDRWTMYRADVCAVSHSGRYLFASSRANSAELTGYVAAFKLADDGRIERQILLNPTPTSGGHSNAVAPADWTDEWLALTDDEQGWLEVYRWQDEFLARVARVRVPEPGFGMNAIWYD
ncbi:3-carboxy-cis,cis-muconate cyclase [Cordyceps fumosorosea ARSEF 2679]|uniref:3-carboxy-cis,cis-muconate cyclase n=1 Tax=Cordyceps fumosorosea (strain ARSEF 2679) TaxID=1081104 RepID=A0A168BMF7_CORFA|nr:3-carboxy-cis,cis-muconate cyclase [Cordyceps fumosorosea ARSEF 2679]OAA70307.1 3-carboxy-cis,cis-muconate cyclase [Cordyceps fumosorosea ARSEF 2679]